MAGLSVTEAAGKIGVSRQAVWKYIKTGKITAAWEMHGIRRVARISNEEVERFQMEQASKLENASPIQ